MPCLIVLASFATIFLSAVDRQGQLQIWHDMGFSLLFDRKEVQHAGRQALTSRLKVRFLPRSPPLESTT